MDRIDRDKSPANSITAKGTSSYRPWKGSCDVKPSAWDDRSRQRSAADGQETGCPLNLSQGLVALFRPGLANATSYDGQDTKPYMTPTNA